MTDGRVAEQSAATAPGSVRIGLHRLAIRPQPAEGGSVSWVVGRVETGVFIVVPDVGRRAIALLEAGHTIDEARAALRAATGADVDVAGFAESLVDLGFVVDVQDRPVPQRPVPRPTLPRLRPRHVRWLLHPATGVLAALAVLAAGAALAVGAAPVPTYRDVIWSDGSGAAVLLGNTALAWLLILLHELGHLATARAAGVPGRMSLGTRLQFLVAQTDVSGVWGLPRRTRLAVYLSGITVNLVVCAACVLVPVLVDLPAQSARVVTAVGLLSFGFVPVEFLVFMRTDAYYVLQDLTRATNLYADGSAYARYLAARVRRRVRGALAPADPSRRLPALERRAVRAYTALLVVGTVGCLAVAALVTVPAMAAVTSRSVAALAADPSPARAADATVVVGLAGVSLLLWCRAWWRRHGDRVRRWAGRATATEGR